jgi:hypothetical protein
MERETVFSIHSLAHVFLERIRDEDQAFNLSAVINSMSKHGDRPR